MPAHLDTFVLAEQALSHVLDEQRKLLKRSDIGVLREILAQLVELSSKTHELIKQGIKRNGDVGKLLTLAQTIEKNADDLSEEIWSPILINVSAIYEKMESSLDRKPGSDTVKDVRDQYHNLRIRLLEQTIGARMLTNNNDLGEEHERIWQQFLQNQLGPTFIVLRGGHILDHSGQRSKAQIDLIVVAAGASFITPGDSKGGKANVFIDDVIAAIMLKTTLTKNDLTSDWEKLQTLPDFKDKTKDLPQLEKHAWPLCYIFSSQSDPIDELRARWEELAKTTKIKFLPQVLVSLDGGSMFSGAMAWPRPCYPGNYTQAEHVKIWSGLDTGMGIAWSVLQIKGRLAAIEKRALGSIVRFAGLLDRADMKDAVPPTWSQRFYTMFRQREIAGPISWGGTSCFAHNRLSLNSVRRSISGTNEITSAELYRRDADQKTLKWDELQKNLRWFHYGITHIAGNFLALEEWEELRSKDKHRKRIAVFNITTGEEITGPEVTALQSVAEVEKLPMPSL